MRTVLLSLPSLLAVPRVYARFHLNFGHISQVFAFGDSYTFVQGTSGFPNFSYVGDLFNLHFTAETLLSDEIIPKNTSSGGSNWLEFLTGCFGGRPSDCAVQLWDFAFAGSDISSELLPLHHNYTIPLVDQVRQFVDNNVLSIVPAKRDSERMTVWWIGINDTSDIIGRNTTSLEEFWVQEMEAYFTAIETAYITGLRGTYLFINVPPEERSPANVGNPENAGRANDSIVSYNAALSSAVAKFSATHTDVHVSSFDAHAWFNAALNHATALGFANTTGFCQCKDPSFFWYNSGHPTERVHRLLASAIEAQLHAESVHWLAHDQPSMLDEGNRGEGLVS
ncbi:hypothetical protein K488DRAFT_41084 [Vararia minispora EC-137]|uniref:Uncharacterized protein n=1 Tax=Vararia minispora EC-137 TaxID=1314806 RepID=A0ACB8QXR9_9AGAM|nr:hypothetical protein K488DRAFT_41084 [Vararia minispora EC-137]